ncbi:8-amino-7-oxononanoate synthase [[Haemophilus] ducreyi]|uniref:8-amino-7-oxononanoate synthase n=1 Tax=Haemophilus ducreyi (strain 35000HP / ATCC 700724) TaxID=233412 RepID=BIOF_HAEDU|nr:8-amino-7-oxononanoate synthase [[Haemophilus] ducreyi]Q7VL09.1 RecName: Full=8-amino-7-oxononanoate synthase; Short=AONS; AltName: Full=7-keto-8-amino-pelargonic acid synthase; Short=7-KAP synthase; Short=KAPA synthase; AltName: Full=8-amino-7-ketopelargonate synthase [[Haemophilus] ducreyi 35000HP]AAP96450.1 8-amino-7-oxononanoate synthase [[Haemophilus] ducreyi 35000HP]AKO40122.1 8-amino-7-oxononanoate synthase [[Haemophilus] ducreyi]ASE07058.1 8-amino-7-oxononanoate synthase [[Haemophilu
MSYFAEKLAELAQVGLNRSLPEIEHQGKWIIAQNRKMLNFSSNDYLGLASDTELQQTFLQNILQEAPLHQWFSSSSSRLLTGNFPIYARLEQLLAQRFQRETALLFNSGYHANIGILPALVDKHSLILADKLVHASLIDGTRLAGCDFYRYQHNNLAHLTQLLEKHTGQYRRIIIVTESVFSMDGDVAPLPQLVALKKAFSSQTEVMLYVDEAHAIGVYGANGLGMAEFFDCIDDIDLLVGTFGKALASMGAYLICDQLIKQYLVNTMRPLIFSTALAPINVAWTHFLFEKLPQFQPKRAHLARLSQQLKQAVELRNGDTLATQSCIVPFVVGENRQAVEKSQYLQQQGYYCLPIRPPTVPKGTARIRFSLTADLTEAELNGLIACL